MTDDPSTPHIAPGGTGPAVLGRSGVLGAGDSGTDAGRSGGHGPDLCRVVEGEPAVRLVQRQEGVDV